jgi:uncharacterized sporulation protein YeaH/YhbH (DUF444 family)
MSDDEKERDRKGWQQTAAAVRYLRKPSVLASSAEAAISERDLRDAKVLRWAAWATEDMMHGSTIREALRKRAEEIEQGKARLPLPNNGDLSHADTTLKQKENANGK